MINREYYITLKNELYNSNNITNEELVILSLIKRNYSSIKEISIISINMIMNYMYVLNRNSNMIKIIKNSINNLISKGYIKQIMNLHYSPIEFDTIKNSDMFYVEIENDFDNYFCIYDYDLDKIFKYLHNTNIDRFAFVRYYIAIQRVINNDAQFGWLTHNSIKNIINHSKTISKYNKILANELNLIIYNNDYMTPDRHYCSTYFGKYGDNVNFNKQLQIEIGAKGLIYTNKFNSNIKRSNTQKRNLTKLN
ncbi:conserved hypothetical protein [Clostridium phage D-1873]|uniref:Uncharacterized protein n=1 Tax=Clostridium botulinum D str. 1873 TaxID=592027 RepID=A0A9P2G5G4_CLOBO|nr:hypothetical protein [Clostridium botulinum]EES90317.1 conserved hypothetical protein [Clostridium phage D-1873]MCD3245270.1 hypothetical protein [Clostridium botulinum C]MCD3261649.1 hypothetical protein [Clostridium botulinum C]QPW56479.1 hypothetical protein IRP61_11445 [Clostridium botulinum]